MVSVDSMLISILSVSVEVLEMLCAEAAEALAPQAWDLMSGNLLSPLRLMCDLRNRNFVLYQILTFCHLLQGLSRLCLH